MRPRRTSPAATASASFAARRWRQRGSTRSCTAATSSTCTASGPGWSVSRTARPAACQCSGLRQHTQRPPQGHHPQQREERPQQQSQTQQRCQTHQRCRARPQLQRAPGRPVQLAWSRPQQRQRQGRPGLPAGLDAALVAATGRLVLLLGPRACQLQPGELAQGVLGRQLRPLGALAASLPCTLDRQGRRPPAAAGTGVGAAPGSVAGRRSERGSGGARQRPLPTAPLLQAARCRRPASLLATGRAAARRRCLLQG